VSVSVFVSFVQNLNHMHCCMLSDSVNNTNTTVFTLIASDTVAGLRAQLLRKHRNMFRHAQENLITV